MEFKETINRYVNKYMLFQNFYNEFLLKELKNYINQKLDEDYKNINEIFNNKENLPMKDCLLVETFMEVGSKTYLDMFSYLDLDNKEKVYNIINKGKEFFDNIRKIEDNSKEKYDQYYKMFELIAPYLQNKFKKEGLFKEKTDLDLKNLRSYLDLISKVNKEKNIICDEFKQKKEVKEKWNLNIPEEYADYLKDKSAA